MKIGRKKDWKIWVNYLRNSILVNVGYLKGMVYQEESSRVLVLVVLKNHIAILSTTKDKNTCYNSGKPIFLAFLLLCMVAKKVKKIYFIKKLYYFFVL